jgi:hypothetical protein
MWRALTSVSIRYRTLFGLDGIRHRWLADDANDRCRSTTRSRFTFLDRLRMRADPTQRLTVVPRP